MKNLVAGHWLGIDIGSSKEKVCSFCLISSDGQGTVKIKFEKGIEPADYPSKNQFALFIDRPLRRPTYLKSGVEEAVGQVLEDSELVTRWLEAAKQTHPAAVAIDAPVAFAAGESRSRTTERASTHTFNTTHRAAFEALLDGGQKPGTYNSQVFWKCVGFAVYRWLAQRLDEDLAEDFPQEVVAAWTCNQPSTAWRVRETFPSDVYKKANSRDKDDTLHRLTRESRRVLRSLVKPEVCWNSTNASVTYLERIKRCLQLDLAEENPRSCEMRKRSGVTGDLWDAFTCAYAACCEDHDAAAFHGWDGKSQASKTVAREGAILTVASDKIGPATPT